MSGQPSRNPYFQWYQQHKTLVWGAAAAAVTVYATYKLTQDATDDAGPSRRPQQRSQTQFQRITSAIRNYSAAASTLAETAAIVSEDLRSFLTSDSAELPQSLRQLNKLLQAPELQETVSTVTASVMRGVTSVSQGGPPLADTIIEAVLSDRGRGLVGMAVGIAMRNSTQALCEFVERRMEAASSGPGGAGGLGVKDILDILTTEQGEKVLTLLLTQSIRTAVTSYVDSTAGYNLYNDMLSSLVNQEHRDALTDLLSRITASFCREAVLSYRRAAAAGAGTAAGSTVAHGANHNPKYAAAAAACGGSAANRTDSGLAVSCSAAAAPAPNVTTVSMAASCSGSSEAVSAPDGRAASSLPLVKSNGQLAAGGRPSQGAQLFNRQFSLSGNGLVGAGSLSRGVLAQTPPAWVRQVVELVRERDVRSLAVDVVKCASREATRGAVEGLLQSSGVQGEGGLAGGVIVMPPCPTGYKLYIMATLAVSLCMYALSPRVMML